MTVDDDDHAAARLLLALREAGSYVFLDEEGTLFCSPPSRCVVVNDRPIDGEAFEELFEELYSALRDLVLAEGVVTIH